MKKILTVWILLAVMTSLNFPVFSADLDYSHRYERTIMVEMYDLAGIRSRTLAQGEQLAARIFATAEIDTRWTSGSALDTAHLASDFSASSQRGCASAVYLTAVRVQLLLRAPNGFSSQALGYALPCAERGMQVTLYADRMRTVSCSTFAGFSRVLGYALAHEIGHVLLRSSTHESHGLMKAVWAKNDWQRAAVMIIPFTPEQARQMTGMLRRADEQIVP